jgi:NOL1/NOP2/fmu family ribosome biogenesis protein
MAYGSDFKPKIDLERGSEELKKYLRGEQIEVDCEDGWAVITVCGCALGGVKVVKGVAKNHYPKGLRAKS